MPVIGIWIVGSQEYDIIRKAMRILIDGCVFERPIQRGIQRYYFEILSRLPSDIDGDIYFHKKPAAATPQTLAVTQLTENFDRQRKDVFQRGVAKFRRKWCPTKIPNGDVFHSTYFTRSPDGSIPEILTVHDMIAEIMPYNFDPGIDREIAIKRECILNASKIIVISEATGADLIALYPEVSDKVKVIHMGGQHFPCVNEEQINSRKDAEKPYVIFIGERRNYKNFATLVDALKSPAWPKDLDVVVVGPKFSEGEKVALKYRGLENRFRISVHPSDVEMRFLLTEAKAFIFPSLLEGFGFPMVEAQALGVPVVASDTKVFNEVGGEAFIPVNSLDPDAIAAGVVKALSSGERVRLGLLGLRNIRRFSWDDCAKRTFSVWEEASQRKVKQSA